jgi:hypothetical protein
MKEDEKIPQCYALKKMLESKNKESKFHQQYIPSTIQNQKTYANLPTPPKCSEKDLRKNT